MVTDIATIAAWLDGSQQHHYRSAAGRIVQFRSSSQLSGLMAAGQTTSDLLTSCGCGSLDWRRFSPGAKHRAERSSDAWHRLWRLRRGCRPMPAGRPADAVIDNVDRWRDDELGRMNAVVRSLLRRVGRDALGAGRRWRQLVRITTRRWTGGGGAVKPASPCHPRPTPRKCVGTVIGGLHPTRRLQLAPAAGSCAIRRPDWWSACGGALARPC